MDMVVFAVHLNQGCAKVIANSSKHTLHGVVVIFPEYAAPVFGDKDQVNVQVEYAMPAGGVFRLTLT